MSWLSWCRRLQQTLQLTSSGMSLCRFPIMSMAGKACWMVNTCDATIPWALALQSATSPCKIECKVTHHKDSASEKSIDRTKALPILLQTFPNEPSGTLGDPSGTLRGPFGDPRGRIHGSAAPCRVHLQDTNDHLPTLSWTFAAHPVRSGKAFDILTALAC